MRGMNSESVDLIYLDPPFNSNRDYAAPIGSEAAGAAFKDTWTLSDVDEAWHGEVADRQPALYSIIDAAGMAHGQGMKSYLIMMAVRVLEMHRLLKPTGSLFLHCDPTASHYLKMLMDSILGQARFRNEIVWRRTTKEGLASTRFASGHDTLLLYSREDRPRWNPQFEPHDPEYVRKFYRYVEEETGRRYRHADLTNPNKDRPNLTYEFLGIVRVWRWTRARMMAEYERGRIIRAAPGNVPVLERYLDEQTGPSGRRPVGRESRHREGRGDRLSHPEAGFAAGSHNPVQLERGRHHSRRLLWVRHSPNRRRQAQS